MIKRIITICRIYWLKKAITLLLAITLILEAAFNTAHADLNKLIKNVMPRGTMSNVTVGGIVREQEAGHLMGGSVIIKTPAEPGLQLIQAKAPSCKMGGLPCGAQFEFLGGAVSIVNSAELMRHLKGLAQNAGSYGAMMLVKTMCSHCEDLMTWLDNKADWLNSLAKTDCEDIARHADGMLGKITAGSRAIRQSASFLNGDKKDLAGFSQGSKKETEDPTEGNPELESMLGDNYNLVWKALEGKAPASSSNNSLKEVLMSISGTIIGRKDSAGRRSVSHKVSLINKEMIEEFIGAKSTPSKEVNLYVCDEATACLTPTIIPSAIKAKDSLMGRVEDLLISITKKIKTDKEEFTDEESTLIAMSSLSLVTKIELDLANYSGSDEVVAAQSEFIEALCFDVVTTYLAKLLQEVQQAVSELQYAQIADSGAFNKFDQECRETLRALSRAKNETFKRYDLIAQTKARLRAEIKHFEFKFEEYCSGQNES